MPATGAAVNGTSAPVFVPGSTIPTVNTPADPETSAPSTGYTEVTSDLYYSGGHLGTLKIPAIGLTVKVYEGTDSKTLAKGAGHFEETSIWRGNIAVAAHNRGTNNHFGKIHTLELGDEITLTTKLGTRTYEVVSVAKVSGDRPERPRRHHGKHDHPLHLCDEPERLPLVRQGSGNLVDLLCFPL